MNLTLADVMTAESPVAIPDHLDAQARVPVVTTTPVAQGDLLISPQSFPRRRIVVSSGAAWQTVGAGGVKIIDSADTGGHDHVLVARPGTCRVTFDVAHPSNLAICVVECDEPASIQHPEHGAILLDPAFSPFECRGQREWMDEQRRVAD